MENGRIKRYFASLHPGPLGTPFSSPSIMNCAIVVSFLSSPFVWDIIVAGNLQHPRCSHFRKRRVYSPPWVSTRILFDVVTMAFDTANKNNASETVKNKNKTESPRAVMILISKSWLALCFRRNSIFDCISSCRS